MSARSREESSEATLEVLDIGMSFGHAVAPDCRLAWTERSLEVGKLGEKTLRFENFMNLMPSCVCEVEGLIKLQNSA